jgi:hypothetical protein
MKSPDKLSALLKIWRVDPTPDPCFRFKVLQRLKQRQRARYSSQTRRPKPRPVTETPGKNRPERFLQPNFPKS